MREPIRDKGRLEHMLSAIDRVIDYMEDKSFDDLPKEKAGRFSLIHFNKAVKH